jgi:DNA invertase Pin-like site-specific DNA recombinase
LVFHLFGSLAEFERDLIRERTKKLALARQLYNAGQMDIAIICQTLGISRSALYRVLNDRS